MQRDVLTTKKARISKNHHALYTALSCKAPKSSAQKGPNWFT